MVKFIVGKATLFLFAIVSLFLLLGSVFAQGSPATPPTTPPTNPPTTPPTNPPTTPPATPSETGCAPNNSADDKCAIYSISRENVEKHWPGCSAVTPQNCPVIPTGATNLPSGISPGQMIDTDAIVEAVISRLREQKLPADPPKDWTTVLAAKRTVMSKILGVTSGKSYKGPKMIDFKGKKPVVTGGNPNGATQVQPNSQTSNSIRPVTQLISLAFAKFFKFFELPVYSASANPIIPSIPVVITVEFRNPDGTVYTHSLFCWATGVNIQNGDGHYVCHDHVNQGDYSWILDSNDKKITGKRLAPYPGPNQPIEDPIKVVGDLQVIISHDF